MKSDKWGISVVICTYNGKTRLHPTITSIIEQDFDPTRFELIVVDNASDDGTAEFVEQMMRPVGVAFKWRIVSEPNPGLNNARMKGLMMAQFDIVLFCDDDNSLANDYLKIASSLFDNADQIGALGGCGIPSFEGNKPDWFDRYSHSFAVGSQAKRDGRISSHPAELYGAGSFFRKAPLMRFFEKGFSTITSDRKGNSLASGGDVEWCYMVQLLEYEIWYDHRLTFIHAMPEGRLQWSYYLRLKQGIASGAGRLLPYTSLLKNNNLSEFAFLFNWLRITMKSTVFYLKHNIAYSIQLNQNSPESELALVVLRQKMISYWRNGITAFKHFQLLKRML